MLFALLKLPQHRQRDGDGQQEGEQVADGLTEFKTRQTEEMGQQEHRRDEKKPLSAAASACPACVADGLRIMLAMMTKENRGMVMHCIRRAAAPISRTSGCP